MRFSYSDKYFGFTEKGCLIKAPWKHINCLNYPWLWQLLFAVAESCYGKKNPKQSTIE